jgi:3',5'-cyclic-AMP phosphodiesterase
MKHIAFLTDVHLDEPFPLENNVNPYRNLERVVEDIVNRKIEHIVFGGDIGAYTGHQWFFDMLKPFSTNLILGNHDKFEEVTTYFKINEKHDELYYQYDNETYRFIFLDTSSEELSHEQVAWLRLNLRTNKNLVLFIHHPVIEIDTPIDKLYPLKNRETVLSVLIESGKNITLFCGHYHMNDERTYKNIRQIVTQSLSYQLVKNTDEIEIDNANFGYRIIAFGTDKIETHLVNFMA